MKKCVGLLWLVLTGVLVFGGGGNPDGHGVTVGVRRSPDSSGLIHALVVSDVTGRVELRNWRGRFGVWVRAGEVGVIENVHPGWYQVRLNGVFQRYVVLRVPRTGDR